MAKKESKVFLAPVPCSCGGTMRPHFAKEYDASVDMGLPVRIMGQVPGLRCGTCRGFAVSMAVLGGVSEAAVEKLLLLDRRLSGTEARFLRKAALGLSQDELADRLGISRPTVARWEGASSLSATHDFDLRGVVVGEMMKGARLGRKKRRKADLVDLAQSVLSGVRQRRAPKRIPPLQIAA